MPRAVTREFARLAGLLEIADNEFVRVRDDMNRYTEETKRKIIENDADDVLIDMISLDEYMPLIPPELRTVYSLVVNFVIFSKR